MYPETEKDHYRVGPGQSLSCLHRTHGGSRSMITAILGPDFSGSTLVAWWKQHLRDTRTNCQHTHCSGGAESSANNSVIGELTQQSTPTDEQLQRRNNQWLVSQWESSNLSYLALQITNNTVKKHIEGSLLQQLGRRHCPLQDSDNHREIRRPCSITSAGSGDHKISHTSYQEDNSQHILRKEVADIRTKNSPHNKNY